MSHYFLTQNKNRNLQLPPITNTYSQSTGITTPRTDDAKLCIC